MLEELFDDLYRLLRGSTAATSLVDAKTFYTEEKWIECVSLLENTAKRYAEARESTLNKDLSHVEKNQPNTLDKETRRLVRKQDKAHDVLDQMQELIEKIRRNTRLSDKLPKTSKAALPEAKTPQPRAILPLEETVKPVSLGPMASLLVDFRQASSFEEKKAVVESYCALQTIESVSAIRPGDLLLALSDGQQFLLQVDSPAIEEGALRIHSATEGTKLRPLPLEKVSRSISRSKLHLLVLKRSANSQGPEHSVLEPESQANFAEYAVSDSGPTVNVQEPSRIESTAEFPSDSASKLSQQQRDQILDPGAFSQLIDAAQRTGIVPGISIIIQVRDCEFRLGKHHQALQLMESQLSAFVGSAMQRTQRLKREEQDIASGKVKMSPKDMQAKKARDNKDSELIERARTRFTRVLEGIRAIIHMENELEK
ncbi:MAG: hypothetical protein NTY15_03790 [Planctomycetota bacterium]|nr:hypothetical protein [Planctomycetota bacterium]